jgi:hypothetical protein
MQFVSETLSTRTSEFADPGTVKKRKLEDDSMPDEYLNTIEARVSSLLGEQYDFERELLQKSPYSCSVEAKTKDDNALGML